MILASELPPVAEIKRWENWLPRTIGIVAVVSSLLRTGMLWLVHRSVEREAMALAPLLLA